MTTVHLIDGTYELFRAHFGAPPRQTPEGWEIGATHGIIMSTLALLAEPGVTHVGAAFDTVIESFRNDMFDGYKTGEGTPPELHAQFPVAERAMEAIGVTVWPMIEHEADDGLAAAAQKYVPDVDRVVIMSPDKDMCQLYGNPKIVGFNRRESAFIDADGVRAKFGVRPNRSPTTSPLSVTPPMESRACRAGERSLRLRCSPSTATSTRFQHQRPIGM